VNSRHDKLASAVAGQQHRFDMAQRRARDGVFDLRQEAESLTADATLLSRLDVLEDMVARCRANALRVEVEGARLRALLAQAALHGQ